MIVRILDSALEDLDRGRNFYEHQGEGMIIVMVVRLVSSLAYSHWSVTTRVVVGGAGGLACGVLVAWLFNFAWRKVSALILAHYERREQR